MKNLFIILLFSPIFNFCTQTSEEDILQQVEDTVKVETIVTVPTKDVIQKVDAPVEMSVLKKREVKIPIEVEQDTVYESVTTKPVFKGCETYKRMARRDVCTERQWRNYIYPLTNLIFADTILQADDVVVQFIVEKDGSITNVKILKDFGEQSVKSTLDLFNKIKADSLTFIPATIDNQPVRYLKTALVTFSK
jgi:hypothetical protein